MPWLKARRRATPRLRGLTTISQHLNGKDGMIMKKVLAFAVLALTVLSCSKEIAEQQLVPAVEKSYTSFTATGEEISKVALDFAEEQNVKWEDADQLAVFDGSAKNIFSIKAGSNTGASAVFEGEVSDGATTLYAVYPASAGEALEGTDIKVSVPAAQTIPSGAFADPKALVAVASASKGSPMEFKQVCGLLKISFTASNIREITITGKAIAGAASVGADGVLKSASAASDAITLTHADGIFPAGTYYVPVLPGTTPAGSFSISLIKGASTAERTATGAITFERRKGVDAGSLDKLPTTTVIRTMAELFEWNANRVGGTEDNVIIGADIDMENEPWVPKDFTGTFDGQGHKLYNLSVKRSANACFVNTLDGTIKDVTFGTSNGTSYDGQSVIIQNNPDDTADSGWRYAGLVTRLSADAVLENVTTYVPVTVASTSKSKTRIGGLVAIIAGASSVKNCHNYGAVSNEATAPVAAGAVGGLIGCNDAVATVEDCSNSGNITVNNAATSYIGGILSTDEVGGSFTNCVNKGNISVSGTGTRSSCIGGILGDATLSTVSKCENLGSITCTLDGELKVGGIVGRAYKGCTVKDCTNQESGVIDFNPEGATKRAFIGGVVGNSPAGNTETLTIDGCKNYASITGVNEQISTIGGIGGFINGAGVVIIKNCENHGDIANTNAAAKNGTEAAAAYVSGIVAYLNADIAAGSSIENCSNYGAILAKNRNIINVAGIIPVVSSANEVTIKNCHNYGTITRDLNYRSTYADTAYSIGGIIGKLTLPSGSVSGCVNHSDATVWANAGGGAANPRVGGIVGYVIKCGSITNCTNDAAVTYDNTATGGSYCAVGGIVGHMYATQTFDKCVNNGAVSSNRTQVNRLGGIVGTANNSPVTNCTNTGTVTLNCVAQTANWQSVGGIAGFTEGSGDVALDFTGNVNRGKIDAMALTTNDRVAIGGIVGMPYDALKVSGNINYGKVFAKNAATNGACYVGGLLGQELEAGNVSSFTDNKNYGSVENGTEGSTKAFTGGLFGNFGKAPTASGSSFGSVKGVVAGAVAGKNAKAITATICDAVTVNGVAKAAAADEAAWLCPSNTGTITPTYVAHSDSE